MFDTIFGLPVHALVIHGVVVLVPLCAVAVVVMFFSAVWRERLRLPILLLLIGAAVSAFVAKQSGEALLNRLGLQGAQIDRHVQLGNIAPFIVIAFCVLYAAWFWLTRAGSTAPAAVTQGRLTALLAVTAIMGVVSLGWIVATGHAGSTTVWSGIVSSTN